MFSKALTSAIVALAATRMVSAQTFTDCDPLEKTCSPDAAFGKNSVSCDWTKGACSAFEGLPGTTVSYDSKGAIFSIEKESNAPTMATHKRIFFGRVDVELIAAAGQGIVTSLVFESADLDEIDWEWVGGDNEQVQSNYFGKGDTTTYDRGAYHPVSKPLTTLHKYSLDWTKDRINWEIDGEVVRTLTYDEAKSGTRYPQTPMEVKIGTWVAGGKNSAKGTVEWAGGYTDFDKAPFNAYYKSISIVDYAGGDAPTTDDIKEYVWTDHTGSYESIKVVKGDGSSDDSKDEQDDSKDDKETTTSASKTKTVVKTTSTSETSAEATSTSVTTMTTVSATPTPTEEATSSTTETTEETSTTAAGEPSTVPDAPGAAAGVLANFGRVAFAGAAAVAVAQLF
ncbi:glycoside hydrolase family 16 protein [Emericellopsis atlantica]|uniref:Crh-like protein n=1 Tax=Emericellopsis atlantica TaxID=2614577 RepID=A0A9P7ZLE1_9HYPO|nr:glycoside hydrolase family 16 protein [Emericellopsis atlantica]KAG9253745.1 glycoside hydrolase family 16 protein [Emericellopsis atlantica]